MAGFTITEAQTILDLRYPTTANGTHIGYSINGTSEFAGLARTAIGATGWAAATAADPSVKANNAVITSAAATIATGAGGITHTANFSASSGGTQMTDWQAVGTAKVLAIGDQATFAIGAHTVTLT